MIKKIVLATDFSEASQGAVEHAKWLMSGFSDLEVTILHVFNSSSMYMPAPYYFMSESNTWINEHIEGIRGKAQELLASLATELGGGVETRLTEGKPEREIVEFAKEEGADLILMGTHGLTGLNRWVLGSVAEYVVRHAGCGVLTVRPVKESE